MANRFLYLDTNRGWLSISTAGQIHGHAATSAANSFGVAATPAFTKFCGSCPAGPYPFPFNAANSVETFSSDGPRRIFFNADGSAITGGNFSSTGGQVLNKPDLTAADGVAVTGVGGFSNPFYGTSAAAPHAGAIAALVKSNPLLTLAQIRMILVSTAIDIGLRTIATRAPVFDAFAAVQTLANGQLSTDNNRDSNQTTTGTPISPIAHGRRRQNPRRASPCPRPTNVNTARHNIVWGSGANERHDYTGGKPAISHDDHGIGQRRLGDIE